METESKKSHRVSGNAYPAYLNGRPRAMLIEAFSASRAPSTNASEVTLAAQLRNAGVIPGEGVPFAALYMTRAKKKLALLEAA